MVSPSRIFFRIVSSVFSYSLLRRAPAIHDGFHERRVPFIADDFRHVDRLDEIDSSRHVALRISCSCSCVPIRRYTCSDSGHVHLHTSWTMPSSTLAACSAVASPLR